ncbi:MAG: PmoA family protein [Candidatus Hydrogenedentes bacterium]|nr:PmoA family protein [Candidatus Hydrogenedentota bacterium]
MRAASFLLGVSLLCAAAFAAQFDGKDAGGHYDLVVDGQVWLRTMTPTYDPNNREETYKIYTHLFDFAGSAPITKGPGGKYTHHRGLFIGWKDTFVNSTDFDTWHMVKEACTQQHVKWAELVSNASSATQVEEIAWADDSGKTFINEVRAISTSPGDNGLRIVDFQSKLTSAAGTIELKGDLQHAGMQIRIAQEVADKDDAETKDKVPAEKKSTQYVLPAGSTAEKDDKVTGAWWACCSCEVGGKRYWIIHMTHPSTCANSPVYSIRAYARFGAFWEPTLEEGKPQQYNFRIVLSEKPLDAAACQALYDSYAKSTPTKF